MLDEPIHTRGDELDGAMPRGERYAEAQGGGSSNGSKALRSSSGSGSNSSGSSSRSSSSSSSSNNSNNSSSNTNARRNPAEREDMGEGGGGRERVHEEDVHPLTRDEVNSAIDSLKRNKASDEGGMIAEILKCADKNSPLREDIFQILDEVWRGRVCPKAWNSAVIIPLLKKGDTSIMDNYRGIALQDIVEKIFALVLYKRLESIVDPQIYEGQFGFRKGRGTVDAIHMIRQVLESSHEYREPLFICFVDIVKAYDSVDRSILWDALADHHVPVTIIELIKALYYNTTAKVRVGDKYSDPFDLKIGVKQGDILSTLLFNIFLI
jgi:hypothetical protein